MMNYMCGGLGKRANNITGQYFFFTIQLICFLKYFFVNVWKKYHSNIFLIKFYKNIYSVFSNAYEIQETWDG